MSTVYIRATTHACNDTCMSWYMHDKAYVLFMLVCFIFLRWLQSETVLPISFKNLILPEKNPPQSELLDLQPLPVLALRYPQAEALYETKTFGPIETQTFAALYSSDDNVLICAPPNPNGLRTCAEFALLRMLKTESVQRCVCIVPYERCAHRRFLEWKQRFGTHLNLKVCELTGTLMEQ